MKIEIKSRWDEKKIILCGEYESVKDCLERNRGADLRGAYLEGANLRGADLRGAYLRGDKKIISNNVLSFYGFGSENRTTIAFKTDKGIWIQCGCYKGFINEFRDKIKETHKKTQYAKEYLRMCDLIELRYGGK